MGKKSSLPDSGVKRNTRRPRKALNPIRVLNTETGNFVEIDPEDRNTVYAILSHTWDKNGEQTYEQMRNIQRRYTSPVQTPLDGRPALPEGGTSSSQNQNGTPRPSPPPQLLNDSASETKRPQESLEHYIQSEVKASLSHFVEMRDLTSPAPTSASIWDDPELSPKIRDACAIARRNGYRYIWIDSCCIDKSSSSELSEAINSMYKWYSLAEVCYVYLVDVPPEEDHQAECSAFRKSRWFTRGWTLQELIAPENVEFLSNDWALIGSKRALVNLVESVTNIDHKALLHLAPLDAFSVAQRLSWAGKRETTRKEDQSYSLLGIFNIHMPTLYGEGIHAFQRLQDHIIQRTPDQSLFAWGDLYLASQLLSVSRCLRAEPDDDPPHLFANTSRRFQNCDGISIHRHHAITSTLSSPHNQMIEYTPTPYGIRTQFWMIPLTRDLLLRTIQHSEDVQLEYLPRSLENHQAQWYLAILECEHSEYPGHLLGRVCFTYLSNYGAEFVHPGYIHGLTLQRGDYQYYPDTFPLSPEIIQHYHLQTELKTVYIPHAHHDTLPVLRRVQSEPYTAIKLLLLRKTRDVLHSKGYSADLRDPNPDHPSTHCLTLSKEEHHTITVECRHTLGYDGCQFTIQAEVKISGSRIQLESATHSYQAAADHRTVSWADSSQWRTALDCRRVELSTTEAGILTVDLRLDFEGAGVYSLRVDVLSGVPPASSAVELAEDYSGEEKRRDEDGLALSGEIHTNEVDRVDVERQGSDNPEEVNGRRHGDRNRAQRGRDYIAARWHAFVTSILRRHYAARDRLRSVFSLF